MGKPYSIDLRERAVARVEAGESCHRVAALFSVGVSSVIRWADRKRRSGSVAPGQMGGHRPYLINEDHESWLLARIAGKDFTLRELTLELADRGLKVDESTVRAFVHRAGFSFKKNRNSHRTAASRRGTVPGAVEASSGWG